MWFGSVLQSPLRSARSWMATRFPSRMADTLLGAAATVAARLTCWNGTEHQAPPKATRQLKSTAASLRADISQGLPGGGMSIGFSWPRKMPIPLPSRFWKGRELVDVTCAIGALLKSGSDMSRLLRKAIMARRSMTPAPISTLALSRGLLTRAGTTAHP